MLQAGKLKCSTEDTRTWKKNYQGRTTKQGSKWDVPSTHRNKYIISQQYNTQPCNNQVIALYVNQNINVQGPITHGIPRPPTKK